jgi:GntR family transcriptional regulator of arabinose operon
MQTVTPENSLVSKHATLARSLRDQIMSGELQPGDRLPSFAEFKAQFGVAPGTVEKVLTTLEREGLIERFHGKGIFVAQKSTSPKCLGFLCRQRGQKGWGLFWTHLMEGIEAGAHAAGYSILLINPDTVADWKSKVDGIIYHEKESEILAQLPPHKSVRVMATTTNMASVTCDDFGGTYKATEYLLNLGHRRIAYLTWPTHVRLAGYHSALLDAGIEEKSDWVRIFKGEDFETLGADNMRDWLATNWKELGCTALICHNDQTAIGVMAALKEHGVRIPEDISLISFDGTILCETAHPKLASIKVPLREIGLRAANFLIEQIKSGKADPITMVVPTTLDLGASIAAPSLPEHL